MIKYRVISTSGFLVCGISIGLSTFNEKIHFLMVLLNMIGGIMIAIANYADGGNSIKRIYKVGTEF